MLEIQTLRNSIEPMMTRIVRYLRTSGIVPEAEQERLDSAVESMAYLMNIKWIQILIVILAVLVSWHQKLYGLMDMPVPHGLEIGAGETKEAMLGLFIMIYLLSLARRIRSGSARTD